MSNIMLLEQIVLHQMCHLMNNDVAVIFFIKVIPPLSFVFRVEWKLFSQSVHALLVTSVGHISMPVYPHKKCSCCFTCLPILPQGLY